MAILKSFSAIPNVIALCSYPCEGLRVSLQNRGFNSIPRVRTGMPDFSSHIERANLSVRMHLRRFTRKTNAASKTVTNLKSAVALFVAWYLIALLSFG